MYQVSAYVGKPKWCTRSHTHTHTLTPHTHELYVSRSIPSPEGPFYDPEHGRHHLFFGVYPAVGHGPSASDEDGYRCLSDPRPPFFFTPPTHAAHKHTLADANVTRTASLPLSLSLSLLPRSCAHITHRSSCPAWWLLCLLPLCWHCVLGVHASIPGVWKGTGSMLYQPTGWFIGGDSLMQSSPTERKTLVMRRVRILVRPPWLQQQRGGRALREPQPKPSPL